VPTWGQAGHERRERPDRGNRSEFVDGDEGRWGEAAAWAQAGHQGKPAVVLGPGNTGIAACRHEVDEVVVWQVYWPVMVKVPSGFESTLEAIIGLDAEP